MKRIHHLENALNNDHLVDFLLLQRPELRAAHERDASNKGADFEESRLFRKAVMETYAPHMQAKSLLCNDMENCVSVMVDFSMLGCNIKQHIDRSFDVDDDTEYLVHVKNVRIQQRADKTIQASKALHMCKAQLACACLATRTTKAFILGKNSSYGMVDFSKADAAYLQEVKDACAWVDMVHKEESRLCCDPPNHPNLYPNMRVTSSCAEVQAEKHRLATKNKEITLIRNVSPAQRSLAMKHGIDKYTDPRLTAEMMGLKNATKTIVNAILQANRGEGVAIPGAIPGDMPQVGKDGDVAVDIETFTKCADASNVVFMIGMANVDEAFECFIASDATLEAEEEIVVTFCRRLKDSGAKRIIHYGMHEVNVFKQVELRHNISILKDFEWIDLNKKMEQSGYCPQGAFSYSLKSLVPALFAMGMLSVKWDSNCKDGKEAMEQAMRAYTEKKMDIMDDIEKYNRIDVLATMQVWKFYMHFLQK